MTMTTPTFPALPELRRLCRLVTRTVPEMALSGHRLVVHDMRPNFIQVGHKVVEHVHSFYEGHILLEGTAQYITGMVQNMTPGGALVHGPHTVHSWQESDTPCLRLLIWFSIEPVVPVPRPDTWPIWPELLWDASLLFNEASVMLPGWNDRATARMTVILSRLLSIANWPPQAQPSRLPQAQIVSLVDQFLHDNVARPLTLNDVADHVGVSKRSLCRQFLDSTGTTVMERLSNLRMDHAAALLAESDKPVYEIAEDVGLPDPSYFCRRFRIHFHMTPHQYRRQVAMTVRGDTRIAEEHDAHEQVER